MSTDEKLAAKAATASPDSSKLQKVGGGGGGFPAAPALAPEPLLGSLSFHHCTSPFLSSAVSSAAGRYVRSPDLHLLAPAPHTYRSLPPTSAGAMEKDKEMKEVAKVHRGISGGTGAKAGAGAASAAVLAFSGPPGPASVCPHAGASSSPATPATLHTLAGVEVTQVAASPWTRPSPWPRLPRLSSPLSSLDPGRLHPRPKPSQLPSRLPRANPALRRLPLLLLQLVLQLRRALPRARLGPNLQRCLRTPVRSWLQPQVLFLLLTLLWAQPLKGFTEFPLNPASRLVELQRHPRYRRGRGVGGWCSSA